MAENNELGNITRKKGKLAQTRPRPDALQEGSERGHFDNVSNK